MSTKTDVTLVPYATNMTEPSTTQGMMKASYMTGDDNGTMTWMWDFTVQSKLNVNLANNNWLCWYMGFPTTADSAMHQTMAECATYNLTNKAFNDDLTVNNYVWTYSATAPTKSQAGSTGTTFYLGGQATKMDAPWMSYMTPAIEELTSSTNVKYMQYTASAKRALADSTDKLVIEVNGSYMAYGSYYTWNSSAASQAKKDGMMGSMVETKVLEVAAAASNLAAAAAVAVAATMAF